MKSDLAFLEHYKIVRARLRNPPAAKPRLEVARCVSRSQTEAPSPAFEIFDDPAFRQAREALAAMPAAVVRRIQQEVCAEEGIRLEDMLSTRRGGGVAQARQRAIWRVHNETNLTLLAIGRLFNRDHTTVLWAIRKHQSVGIPANRRRKTDLHEPRPEGRAP